MGKEKKTKEEKRADMAELIARLKATPKDKLSAAAKYLLAHENDEPVELNMRYVLR